MKIGDLVRYNAGGSRDKTLALVLDIEHRERRPDGWYFIHPLDRSGGYLTRSDDGVVTLQWIQVDGRYLPRKVGSSLSSSTFGRPTAGEICSHPIGKWWEVVEI